MFNFRFTIKLTYILILLIVNSLFCQKTNYRKGIFLHHSTGKSIWGPNKSSKYIPREVDRFNDSLKISIDSIFVIEEKNWPVTPRDNDWYRWHSIFDGNDTLAVIEPFFSDYEIIIIKSCFPSSDIGSRGTSNDTLNWKIKSIYNYKWHWRKIIEKMRGNRNIFFVFWTNAPLVPNATTNEKAKYSDEFCTWAKDTLSLGMDVSFGEFPSNIYVFDYFHKLAGQDGKLLLEYARSEVDSHPNSAATELVAPQFANEILSESMIYEYKMNILPPELYLPENLKRDVSLTPILDWSDVEYAQKYSCSISEDSIFNKIVYFVDDVLQSELLVPEHVLTEGVEYYWRVKATNDLSDSDYSKVWKFKTLLVADICKKRNTQPREFNLFQNFPNPFNPSTKISFYIPTTINSNSTNDLVVCLRVYDSLGRLVENLISAQKAPGHHFILLNCDDYNSGVYFYEIIAGEFHKVKKMTLLK